MSRLRESERLTVRALLTIAAAWMGLLLLVAIFVPYHGTDALVYGSWSERIAQLGTLRTPGAGNALLHRPLFYGGQGLLWGLFGVHEWTGRLWSWLFMACFLASLMRLAGHRRDLLTAGVAGVLALAIPDVAVQAAAGQTDVPVAALVTLSAALAWTVARSPWRAAGLVAAVAAASLTKPSALPAIAGLAVATLIGSRGELPRRVRDETLPIVAGVALAMVYHVIQARYLGQSLYEFLAGSTEDAHVASAVDVAVGQSYAEARRTIVVGAQWLGPYVAVLAIYAVLYALGRVAGVVHRRTAAAALPLAVALSWLLPYLGQAGARTVRVGPLEAGQPGATIAFVLALVPLWLFARSPVDRAPSRVFLARMLVWTAPMVAAWIELNPSETRYLSAAWAPLVLLMAPVVSDAVRSMLAAHGAAAVLAVAAIPVVLLALNLRNLDSLGTRPDGTYSAGRALADLRLSDLGHPERMRALADPQLAGMLNDARRAVGPRGRLLTNDGRMIFFFDRITVRNPSGCADARGYAAVGLLGNLAAPPIDLRRCRAPRTRRVRAVPGSYTVYAVR